MKMVYVVPLCVFTFLGQCCDVRQEFRIKNDVRFGLPAVFCRTVYVLSYLVQFDSVKSTDDCVWKCYKYSCGMCFIYSISIHAVCVLFYKYSCGMGFILCVFMRYLFYSIRIHAVCVLFYTYACGMCFILLVFMRYVFYSISIHAVCVLFYEYSSGMCFIL